MDEVKKLYESFSEEEKSQVWFTLSRICREHLLMKTAFIAGGLITGGVLVVRCIKKKIDKKREGSN